MDAVIRQAEQSDAEAISRMVVGMAHYFLTNPVATDAQPFLETLTPMATAKRIESERFRYFVAEDAGALVGVIAMRDGGHLYHLFVDAKRHRQGIARALWEHARAESGNTSFTVNSSLFAVPAYQRLGFIAKSGVQSANGFSFVPMVYGHD
jgi:GNAT superfamily N-acetyltransferase